MTAFRSDDPEARSPIEIADAMGEAVEELHAAESDGAVPEQWRERKPLDLRLDAEPEPPNDLVAGKLARGSVGVASGDTKTAKSWTAMELSISVAEQRDEWLGYPLRPREGRVIYIDEEQPVGIVRARMRALGLDREHEDRVRYFHRLGVQLGAADADWDAWLRWELDREPVDVLVIDTGTTATAPDPLDNKAVAEFYVRQLRPLAAEYGIVVLILLHERKPPTQGPRGKQTMATLGARAWITQADSQIMFSKRGPTTEEPSPDGGITMESKFTMADAPSRDGGAEQTVILRISSALRADRALLATEIVNEGEPPKADDEKAVAILADVIVALIDAGSEQRKAQIAEALGIDAEHPDWRSFERALKKGIEDEQLIRPKKGTYGLPEWGE